MAASASSKGNSFRQAPRPVRRPKTTDTTRAQAMRGQVKYSPTPSRGGVTICPGSMTACKNIRVCRKAGCAMANEEMEAAKMPPAKIFARASFRRPANTSGNAPSQRQPVARKPVKRARSIKKTVRRMKPQSSPARFCPRLRLAMSRPSPAGAIPTQKDRIGRSPAKGASFTTQTAMQATQANNTASRPKSGIS